MAGEELPFVRHVCALPVCVVSVSCACLLARLELFLLVSVEWILEHLFSGVYAVASSSCRLSFWRCCTWLASLKSTDDMGIVAVFVIACFV